MSGSYQSSLRVARVYAQAAAEREDNDTVEAIAYYKKALGACAEAIEKCHADGDSRIVEEQADAYRMRIAALSRPPPKKETHSGGGGGRPYKASNEEDTAPKEKFELAEPKTTFADVAGMGDLKKRLERAIIWPLMYPERYEGFVGKKSKGILLYGPPGCGKTYIAKSVAGEATKRTGKKISFIYAKASDILDSWVGNSEKNMRAAFETAAEKAPCILFFDELDGIGGARRGRSVYADRLVNEFLTDFDIVEDKTVLVIGATNTPWDVDSALVRSGRIGRKIVVEPPDKDSRVELYKIHTKGKKLGKTVDFNELADLTDYYASSDIEEICSMAGEIALEEGIQDQNRRIEQGDFVTVIAEHKSSLEQWCCEAERQLRNNDVRTTYPDLIELTGRIRGRKVT